MNEMPTRTADTMSEAIALSSPNGHTSKRATVAAQERLRVSLFGKDGLASPTAAQPTGKERLLAQAKELRLLASRGMKPRAYAKEALRLEAEAAKIISC